VALPPARPASLRATRPASLRAALRAAAAALALLLPAAAVPAQDAPAPAPAPPVLAPALEGSEAASEEFLRRWKSLEPDRRERLRRAFDEFRRLPREKQDALRARFRRLGGREGLEAIRRQVETLRERAPEQVARLRRQGEAVRRLEKRLVDALPADLRERLGRLEPDAREWVRRGAMRQALESGRRTLLLEAAAEGEGLADRVRRHVLGPHAARLATLAPEARAEEEVRLFAEAVWSRVEPRLPEIADRLRADLDRTPEDRLADGRRRFREAFGADPDDLGAPWAARALLHLAALVPAGSRAEATAEIRAGVERIRALPREERAAAVKEALDRWRVRFHPARPRR
jgi:hypothetical protein